MNNDHLCNLSAYDKDVLRHLDGRPTKVPMMPGAAYNATREYLTENGYIERNGGALTQKAIEVIGEKHRLLDEADRNVLRALAGDKDKTGLTDEQYLRKVELLYQEGYITDKLDLTEKGRDIVNANPPPVTPRKKPLDRKIDAAFKQLDLLFDKTSQEPLNDSGRYFTDGFDLTSCHHGDTGNFKNTNDGTAIAILWNLWRAGGLAGLSSSNDSDEEIRSLRYRLRLAEETLAESNEVVNELAPAKNPIYLVSGLLKDYDKNIDRHMAHVGRYHSQQEAIGAAVELWLKDGFSLRHVSCGEVTDL